MASWDGIWAKLQLLLPHHTHAILTNHHCDQQGPLVATHTDIHRRPAGEVATLRLVGATITIVYITPTQMKIMAQCHAHHAPFLSDPQWPARHVFQAYLRACATKAGRDMPGPKDIDTAYTAFQRQHPRPRLSEHKTPNDGGTTQGEPTPSAEGWTPPTILLLAPNGHKHATRTVQRHHAPWSIPKHNAPETDVPPVRHSDQGISRTCWHCGPAALNTLWPLLHLISTHYRTPTAAATADQQAWLSPWFHTVPPDHPAHVAWTRTPTATWMFTNERADPDSVAIEYDRCDPHRAGPQEAPMRPLQHKCPTLRGDKDDKERRQTITCQKFHPNTGYLFHLMYAYITQGRPDRGLFRLTPRAQAIITQGIGLYAAPLLQPTQITARTAQGNPIYVYHPTAIARLAIPSDTDIIYFTDASGTQQRTPTVGSASVRITRHVDGLHVEHHTGATIFGASSHRELRTMADAVTATPPPTAFRPRNIWVVVDATVDIHHTRRLADLPLHKALESGLTTQALGLWMASWDGIWAKLQLLLPHHTHAILTNHHCDQQGPLVATHTDIHRRPAGEVATLRLVGATITIVYITPTQMKIMAQCHAHHAPFLSDPQWPARHVFQAYLRACATKAGRDMPGPKDIDTAYTAFQRQHPRPRLSEHKTPNDGGTTQGEPTPSAEGWTPPTILLLAPNGHKHATRTVQRHHAPWSIPKHNAPETDVPPVRHSDQGISRTCWHCGPAALNTLWPLLHLISTHYRTPTAAATADQQAWLSPWFHTVPPDHPAHVAWTRTPTATWMFTNERADPDSVAIEYDRCDPHRAGPQEAPMRPLQHKCPTLRGDKDDKERRQTITCQKFHPNTGYLFHLMYAYITQGRPDRGLFRLTPRAQAIITQGIGLYAAPLLQPTQITARTAQGNPIYVYHPTAIARLAIPSDTDIIYFTDASGTQQRTPTVGSASVRITRHVDGLHVEHHTGATIFGASSHRELRTMADAVTATPPPTAFRPRNIWVVVDATVDIHHTRRLADLPLHKALESGLTTQALGLWMAFKGMHPEDALHIVKQESHRYAYGNGRADTEAKHQNTNHTPGLERVRLDTPHHSHLQHLPPIPPATQPPQWMPEDTPYTVRRRQYHYPTPI